MAYREAVDARLLEPIDQISAEVGCLMLARVDGKSPAEYLTPVERDVARELGRRLLLDPCGSIRATVRTCKDGRSPIETAAPVVAGGLAWEALDSRGRPTVGCELRLESGATGAATVPSGASTGRYEATELRDGGERFGGLGVQRAVGILNNILLPAIAGRRFENQHELDAALVEADGGPESVTRRRQCGSGAFGCMGTRERPQSRTRAVSDRAERHAAALATADGQHPLGRSPCRRCARPAGRACDSARGPPVLRRDRTRLASAGRRGQTRNPLGFAHGSRCHERGLGLRLGATAER